MEQMLSKRRLVAVALRGILPPLCMAVALSGCAPSAPMRTVGPRDAGPSDAIETSPADRPGASPSDTAAVAADGNDRPDASPSDTAAVAGDRKQDCRSLPEPTQVNDAGATLYWWYFHWQDTDLASTCASYGDGAKMVLEAIVPQNTTPSEVLPRCTSSEVRNGGMRVCTVSGSFRFEADCTASELLIQLPSQYAFDGYYHIESTQFPNPPRGMVWQDVHCGHDLYTGGPAPAPVKPDAGSPSDTGPPADATAPLAGDAPASVDAPECTQYPQEPRVDSTGTMVWWWHFGWQQSDLASVCASYGPGAKMVLELGGEKDAPATSLPACTNSEVMGGGAHACAISRWWRIEADCTAGDLLFELPVQTGSGYYHVEGAQVPDAARRFVGGDAPCPRDLRPSTGPILAAEALAAGVPISNYPESNYNVDRLDVREPAANGQPCHTNSDCPRPNDQECFIEAAISDCESAPAGRCVHYRVSNCIIWPGCVCLSFYGPICASYPGTSCDYRSAATASCAACVPTADGGG